MKENKLRNGKRRWKKILDSGPFRYRIPSDLQLTMHSGMKIFSLCRAKSFADAYKR